MMRRLILAALAMLAILSLESCGISRIVGPATTHQDKPTVLGKNQPVTEQTPAADPTDPAPEGERAH